MTATHEPGKDILTYPVPMLTPDGTCSADRGGLEEEPYDLREILGITTPEQEAVVVKEIGELYSMLDSLQAMLSADWVGIYQATTNAEGIPVLVKLAYRGAPSRAEFPLTPEFAMLSNNSRVGLTGERVIIHSVQQHEGPFYVCDAEVKSEACLPIFRDGTSEVIGIIDAESFTEGHFTKERIEDIEDLCDILGGRFPINPDYFQKRAARADKPFLSLVRDFDKDD